MGNYQCLSDKPNPVFQELLDQLQVPLLLLDPATACVLDANVAACTELGYTHQELLALDMFALNSFLQKKEFMEFAKAPGDLPVLIKEGVFTRKDGSAFPVEVKLKPVQLELHYIMVSFRNITSLRLMEYSLHEEAHLRRILIEQSRDGIVTLDQDAKVFEANQSFADMLGYSLEEVHELHVWDWDKSIDKEILLEMIKTLEEEGVHFETRFKRKDGTFIDVEINNTATHFNDKKLVFCVTRDTSERKQIEASQKLAAMVYQSSLEGMMVLDVSGNIVSVNPNFTAITGYCEEEVLGKSPPILQSGLHEPEFYDEIWAELRKLGHWNGEITDKHKNGKVYTAQLSIDMVDDGNGQVQSWVGQFSDISEKKAAEQLIWYQANFDSLTALPNRLMFRSKLDEEIKKSKRTGNALALMFIDLDNFKNVNDSLGHDMGDLLLQKVAERLRECVRETDTIARLGGDEFTIILINVDAVAHISAIIEKLLANISRPIKLGTQLVNVSASIGVTLYPRDARCVEGLLKNADQAMYRSKKEGRNCFHFFAAPSH